MIKRELKTDEQLYIDWASNNPDWLEDMPLNKKNLEMFKKTLKYGNSNKGNYDTINRNH